jgi:ABC-type transport system involved in cytochrome c biogenesis ATPase subunit
MFDHLSCATRVVLAESETMLELRDVLKRYGALTAVRRLTFTARPGEVLGYLGPNGSGKSTTVKMITGLMPPTQGRILFDGVDIQDRLVEYKTHVGYVPEEAHIYTHLTAPEYLRLCGRLRGLSGAGLEARIDRFLRLFGLDTDYHATLNAFSKGMRQKVLLCAALLHNPRIIALSRFRPGGLVSNPAFDLTDEGEIGGVSSHDDESVIAGGRGDQAVVQEAPAEAARAEVSTLDQSSHDERRPGPGPMAGRDDAPQILERSDPVLVVLPVVCLIAGAGEYLLGNRRVLEQEGRTAALKGRKRRIPLVGRYCLDVQIRVDNVLRHLHRPAEPVHFANDVVPGPTTRARRPRGEALPEDNEIQGTLDRLGFCPRAKHTARGVQF